jgi:hypothetical protein
MPKKKYIVKDYVVVAYHTMCQTLEWNHVVWSLVEFLIFFTNKFNKRDTQFGQMSKIPFRWILDKSISTCLF